MRRNPPVGVIVIAIWAFFLGGVALIFSGLLNWLIPGFQLGLASAILIGLFVLGLGIFRIAVGWGLLQLKNWARIAAIVLTALNLLIYLISGLIAVIGLDFLLTTLRMAAVAVPGWATAVVVIVFLVLLAINAVFIWYLLKPDVVRAFEEGPALESWELPPTQYGGVAGPTEAVGHVPPPPPPPPPVQQERKPIQRTMADRVMPSAAGWLHVRSGPRSGKSTTLSTAGRTSLGRDGEKCDVILEDPAVSGEHACVQWENGRFVIYDLASRNGTYVNNTRVQRQALLDGDTIRVGNTTLIFKSIT